MSKRPFTIAIESPELSNEFVYILHMENERDAISRAMVENNYRKRAIKLYFNGNQILFLEAPR